MELNRRHHLVFALLAGAWLLVAGWQVEEHVRVVEAAKSDLRNQSQKIASTLSAVTRALRFRGALFQDRLEPVLNELVSPHTNVLVNTSGLLALGLLNIDGNPVVTAGDTNLLSRAVLAEGEHWSEKYVTLVLPVAGAALGPEGTNNNNTTVVLPPFRDMTNGVSRDRDFFRRERPRVKPIPPTAFSRRRIFQRRPPTPPVRWKTRRHRRPMKPAAPPKTAITSAATDARRGCAG
jgi:hypothetical protein